MGCCCECCCRGGGKEADSLSKMFGENMFTEAVMKERLPKNVFKALKKTMDGGGPLDPAIADVVANAMKDWALEKGATHFCHWFQPMTGITAEKHDSFISPTPDGRTMTEFSGKELIKGEPDASSFPSGGLRSTFEARGYTAWDCTSPVFIKQDGDNKTLFIPSAFCSYTGEALDKKTPLLRSLDALNKQALRVLRAFGDKETARVTTTLGPEQEYFLIDRDFLVQRLDLLLTGRTLFGAPPPKGQEMEDHYFGSLHERVASFMNELNTELWKLGVSAKTQHNEVAPAQYELAPLFSTVNVAVDHNQLSMKTMEKVALRHGFACLLHEKPFAGVNGSGKHNNWSMCTDKGANLLDPGRTPHENAQFLLFLCAVIKAVDVNAAILRASVASAGNDHRLGANEAPPAIISIFLGDQLTDIVEQLAKGGAKSSKSGGELKLGVSTLPPLPKDSTDRNRTSPFAFTGNKFEFRMVGSSMSCAGPNFVLNTIVADVLEEIADELEKAKDVNAAVQDICQRICKEHLRVVFNGNNYSPEWHAEAARRGLPNLKTTPDALKAASDKAVAKLFAKHGVLSEKELEARIEILFENYSKTINIEAQAMIQMASRLILPAALRNAECLAGAAGAIEAAGGDSAAAKEDLAEACALAARIKKALSGLQKAVEKVHAGHGSSQKHAEACRDVVIPAMVELRSAADALEKVCPADIWPLPTYAEMLFVK